METLEEKIKVSLLLEFILFTKKQKNQENEPDYCQVGKKSEILNYFR